MIDDSYLRVIAVKHWVIHECTYNDHILLASSPGLLPRREGPGDG